MHARRIGNSSRFSRRHWHCGDIFYFGQQHGLMDNGYEHMAKNSFQNYMTRTLQMILFDQYKEDANGGGILLRQGVARWCVY